MLNILTKAFGVKEKHGILHCLAFIWPLYTGVCFFLSLVSNLRLTIISRMLIMQAQHRVRLHDYERSGITGNTKQRVLISWLRQVIRNRLKYNRH